MRKGTYLILGLGLCFTLVTCTTPGADAGLGLASEIPFIVPHDFGTGVTIHRVSAIRTGSNVLFLFDYSSDADRSMPFFDPPGGDLISIRQPLPAGDRTIEVRTTIDALKRVRNITVGFYPLPGNHTGHIFLDFPTIAALVGGSAEAVHSTVTGESIDRASPPPQPNVTTIEEARVDRPWISETTELVRNTIFPDTGSDYLLKDLIDYPFVGDPNVIGTWIAVDFVELKEEFAPGEVFWTGPRLDRQIVLEAGGTTDGPWEWTLGHVLHTGGDHTDSLYEIVDYDGALYMFMEH
ncbi:MAG: hypothetical protein V3S41_07510, partial [Spirochaetia bacterium]